MGVIALFLQNVIKEENTTWAIAHKKVCIDVIVIYCLRSLIDNKTILMDKIEQQLNYNTYTDFILKVNLTHKNKECIVNMFGDEFLRNL